MGTIFAKLLQEHKWICHITSGEATSDMTFTQLSPSRKTTFIFMRNLYFHFAAEQCRGVLRRWCLNKIEGKNWNCRKVCTSFFCRKRTWTSLVSSIFVYLNFQTKVHLNKRSKTNRKACEKKSGLNVWSDEKLINMRFWIEDRVSVICKRWFIWPLITASVTVY